MEQVDIKSVCLPMSSETVIEIVIFSKPKLNGVQTHSAGQVNPSPHIASTAALTTPPLAAASHSLRRRCEVLHQETRVDSDEDGRGEVAHEAKNLPRRIRVVERSLLGKSASTSFTDGRNNARRCVQYQKAIGERNQNGWCDGAEDCGDNVEPGVDDRREKRERVHESRVRSHEDGRERGKIACLRRRGDLFNGMRGLVVGEDLVDAEYDVGEE